MIRAARRSDDERLGEIDRLTWSPVVSPLTEAPERGPFFARGLEPAGVLVAEVDGEVAGYVALGSPTRLRSNAHVQAVHGLAVAPAYQGRGIGRELMLAAAEEARRRGARRLTLRVLAENRGARRLYESLGFVIEGRRREEFLLDGRYVDDLLMALTL